MKFDTDKVFKIVSNLLSNAFKFTPEGGTISVTLSLRLEKEGENKLVIEVSDSGIGIPADKQGAIFDRFYQVSSPDKGNPCRYGYRPAPMPGIRADASWDDNREKRAGSG